MLSRGSGPGPGRAGPGPGRGGLSELEAAGVLRRLPLRHNTRAYALTDRGRALGPAIEALRHWGASGA